jgi:sRNA-binding protein
VGGTNTLTVLYQVGEVTEFTAGQSLTVKSADGFTATYVVTADTAGATSALTVGATVRVIADKDGAKATRVQVLQAGATN